MQDLRYDKLAGVLINHSTHLQKGEKILLEAIDVPPEMVVALIRKIISVGGIPLISIKQNIILRELYSLGTENSIKIIGELEAERMKKMDAYVGLRGSFNITELSDVPQEKMRLYQNYWWKPVHIKIRVPHTKWVVLRWPSSSMAQQAGQSTEAFENFYFNVCTLDYKKMSKAMDALVDRMNKTDKVHIKGPGTDLFFSIKDIPAIKQENIRLTFKDGKIINATSDKTETLNKVLDTDDGARYIGEFALGLNPYITKPMLDILFDEKISGSFHFTPGQAYDEADNGNKSKVHWDMVCIQTPEYGGGEIYFDDELIRKDGLFVTDDLIPLNPDNLK